MPLLWRSSRESRSERCKRAFLLAPICKVLLAPTLVSDRAMYGSSGGLWTRSRPAGARGQLTCDNAHTHHSYMQARTQMGPLLSDIRTRHGYLPRLTQGFYFAVRAALSPCSCRTRLS